MVAYLFQGSFKKQAKFNQFVCKLKEPVVTLTLEPVPPEECQQSSSAIPRNGTNVRLPASFDIPAFPRHLQTKLDNKEPCQRNPKDRHIMIRVLYEAVALYTMYPTTSEYVQVVKILIAKYPFLKDLEGNGYHTWHMSLRRKFKWERAPLVDNSEVRGSKEKFGHKKSKQLVETVRTSQRNVSTASSVLGEDPSSIEAHVNVLHSQYQKMQPDFRIVRNRMQQTFAWWQKEIADGMTVEDTVKKYPFLRTPTGLFNELERIHPATGNLCQRFNEGFKCIVLKVLHLAQRKSPLFQFYLETKEEALTEDLPDIDFRAALIFLPYIFKENIDHFITLGETDLDSPYPTIQLTDQDWKMAFARRAPNILKVDHIEVCRTSGIDEGIISAFCTYFVFNLSYPRHLKNTLMFLQRYIAKIVVDGDQPLPITVTRQINLLY
ncbi:sterile alpha motif domain-containing protein 3-like isoform X2 [Xyrauchen texanus]|nr:sterile alpha motif domain-containing protein 3-like isoform X2 [Xyrauchen texanus]